MKFFIETWGCQMNEHDSEKMSGMLLKEGHQLTHQLEQADLYLLNTCTIREKAAEKVFSRLGQVRKLRQNQPLTIGVLGCLAQQEQDNIFKRAPYVNFVMGPQSMKRLVGLVEESHQENHLLAVESDPENHLMDTTLVSRTEGYQAKITIMEGCDNFCTYCIVPFTRGRERCRPLEDILAEVRSVVAKGFVEIELLGQNVNSYRSSVDFADLLAAVAEIPGVTMLRYISPHPKDFNEKVIRTIAAYPNIGTNIHLPAQSGNSRVLKRMGREHTREEYMEKVTMIRELLPEFSLTSDFIVGFPGETQEAFEETVTLVEWVGYDRIFSFKYSPRPMTGALKHGDPIPEEIKAARLALLQERQLQLQAQKMAARVGEQHLLWIDRIHEDGHLSGKTRSNLMVHLLDHVGVPQRFLGAWHEVLLTGSGNHTLRGRLLIEGFPV